MPIRIQTQAIALGHLSGSDRACTGGKMRQSASVVALGGVVVKCPEHMLMGDHIMDLAALTAKVAAALAGDTSFNDSVKFDFGSDGKLFIDGGSNKVSNDDESADATIQVTMDDFKSLAAGDLDPMQAVMSGKLKILGDMGVAMKLQSLLSKLS